MSIFDILIDWSEVWALLIPLAIIIIYRDFEGMKLLIYYVLIALVLNLFSTTSYFFNSDMPAWLKNNNIFYNLHSIARVVFFGLFIYRATPRKDPRVYRLVFTAYMVFVLLNFIFIESPFYFNTWLFAAESVLLLVFCISFYFKTMQDESRTNWIGQPAFIVTSAVIIYEAITFFIFLFIIPMAEKNPAFGLLSLKIYKITFILFCILLAFALYKSRKVKHNLTI